MGRAKHSSLVFYSEGTDAIYKKSLYQISNDFLLPANQCKVFQNGTLIFSSKRKKCINCSKRLESILFHLHKKEAFETFDYSAKTFVTCDKRKRKNKYKSDVLYNTYQRISFSCLCSN